MQTQPTLPVGNCQSRQREGTRCSFALILVLSAQAMQRLSVPVSAPHSVPVSVDRLGGLRRLLARQFGGPGRGLASVLAGIERRLRVIAREKVPEARGDVRAIIGQPFFVPLYTLFLVYGGVFRLSFGPKVSGRRFLG